MNDKTKSWAFLVLAFVAGFGASRFLPETRATHPMAAKQAEWKQGTRQRFAEMRNRMGEEGRRARPERGDEKGKGKGSRRKGEGGPK